MKHNYLNIYNNLIKLTRNKKLYLNLEKDDTFYERLIFLFFHLALFLKHFKSTIPAKNLQELFDFIIRQIELSIREIGHGDVTVNKKMKEYINLLYSIIEQIEKWEDMIIDKKKQIFVNLLEIKKNDDFLYNYFMKFADFLKKNSLNQFTKEILNLKF